MTQVKALLSRVSSTVGTFVGSAVRSSSIGGTRIFALRREPQQRVQFHPSEA
jgi:hypothetical protein